MDPIHPLLSIIEKLGFPIVTTLGVAGGMWFLLKWMMNTLEKDIKQILIKLEISQAEHRAMLVKLIDRVREMEDSIVRTEIVIRTVSNLQQEWGRIGKAQDSTDKNS